MKQPFLSIIIPAYQESGRIEQTLDHLAVYLRRHNHTDTEVVVVVAESSDGTAKLARAKADRFKMLRVIDSGPQIGKGRDVRTGMFEAAGEYRLFMDADLATPLYYIEEVYRQAKAHAKVVIAVRDLEESHTGIRRLISGFGNWLVQFALLPGITDSQCGFKAFSADAAEELFSRQTVLGWGFDMEILAIAKLQKYPIVQIHVPDWMDKPNGTFEGKIGLAAVTTLGELVQILARKWSGLYHRKSYMYKPYSSQ